MLLGGFFSADVKEVTQRVYRSTVAPDPDGLETSEEDVCSALAELLGQHVKEDVLQGISGWRAALRLFFRTSSMMHLLQAVSGRPLGANLANFSVYDALAPSRSATRNNASGLKIIQCQPWDLVKPSPTLATAACIVNDVEVLHRTCPQMDGNILRAYLDPQRIPGRGCRSISDAIRFRIKGVHDQSHCILASYGAGHEYQSTRSNANTVFGTLLRHQGQVRFFATPELAFLQGLCVPWEGPLEVRMAAHFLGNAISVPHALLGLLNVLCQFDHLAYTEFPRQLFDIAMQSRLHAQNSCITIDLQRNLFRIDSLQVSQTQAWPETSTKLTHVYLEQGKQTIEIWIQQGCMVFEAFRQLFRNYDVSQIGWMPFAESKVSIPIHDQDYIHGDRMNFIIPTDFLLCLDEQMFCQEATEYALALLSEQMILFRCNDQETVHSLTMRVAEHLDKEVQIYNHMLRAVGSDLRPRLVMVVGDPDSGRVIHRPLLQGALLEIGESLQCRMSSANALAFVQACQTNGASHVLSTLGWQILLRIEARPQSPDARIVIIPAQAQLHVDIIAIRNVLASHLTAWQLPDQSEQVSMGFQASLKLWSTIVWQGSLKPTTDVDIFARAWHDASKFTGPHIPVHTIWRGRRLVPGFKFQDYLPTEPNSIQRFHLVGHLSGGGSKVDHAIQVNQQCVTFLLQCGASSISTPKFVAEFIQYAGLTRVQQILSIPDMEMRLEQLKQTASHYKVPLPEFADLETDRMKKIKSNARKWKPVNQGPRADLFQRADTLFKTHDGKVMPNGSKDKPDEAVCLLDATDLRDFVQAYKGKFTHCVAICLGTNCPIADSSCSVHNLPAFDSQGHKVIVATCIHQIGTQPTKLLGSDADEIPADPTTVLALTAWQIEMTPEAWQQVLEAPLRTMWRNFNVEPSNTVIPKPWGRSWRDGTQVTDANHATSFQVHVRVYSKAVPSLLALSGKGGIFVTPKGERGHTADSSYAIVWLKDKSLQETIALAESIDGHAGTVRSYRGKQAYGIRIPSELYESTCAKLNPEGPKQVHVPANYFCRLSPLPHGTGFDDVKTWLHTQSLKMRPIRAMSSTVWLLASSTQVDTSHYLWGRDSVLLEQIDSKRDTRPRVVAGAKKVLNLDAHVPPPDHLQMADPWANFVPIISDGSQSSSSSSRSTVASTATSRETWYSESKPIHKHSDNSELKEIKQQIEILSRESKEHKYSEKQLRNELHSQIQNVRKEVKEQIESTEQSFRQTLDTRIHQLEQSITRTQSDLQSGFKEVLSRLVKPDQSDADNGKRKKADVAMEVDP